MFSLVAHFTGEPNWLVAHIATLESEMREPYQAYDHWWEVWALEQNLPRGMRVAYLPFDAHGCHKLGYVPIHR